MIRTLLDKVKYNTYNEYMEVLNMWNFEEYLSQGSSSSSGDHYDKHTDRYVNDDKEPLGYVGHCDCHTDKMY